MPEFFDFDPTTGVRYDFDYDEATGNAIIHTSQDLQAVVDHTTKIRNSGLNDKGIKESWWQYAKLPLVIALKMRNEKGINAFDPRETDRVIKEINENYPYLKTTDKNIGGKQRQIYLP